MQIHRLLEIIYILLEKKTVTAKELSERFEVSRRTIYRDIDVLSAAGIPIYTNKGKGGGVSLMESFVLNKSVLSDQEQMEILSSLEGLNALRVPDVEPVLKKLAGLFDKSTVSWIDVDFSYWGSKATEMDKFNLLKSAILKKNVISFDYFNSYGEQTVRRVEPLKIIFKGQGWYLYGFCRSKKDYRVFKIARIANPVCSHEVFSRSAPENALEGFQENMMPMIKLVLRISDQMAYRVYDEFKPENIGRNADGSYTVTAFYPESEWVYGYILSYGNYAEVLEPIHIRAIIKEKVKELQKKYL